MVDCLRRFFGGPRQNETDGQDARATILSGDLPGGEKDHGRRTGRSALPFLGAERTGRGGARRSGGEAGRQVHSYELIVHCLRRFFGGRGKNETDGQDARATILSGTLPSRIRSAQPASSVW